MRVEHDLGAAPTVEELERVCRQRGLAVYRTPLQGTGYYLQWPEPAALVRPGAPPEAIAHELMHHVLRENASYGITYEGPDWVWVSEEEECRRFARGLCGAGAE
jgi:hypothetical protein